jgi:hypothetical protein
MDSRPEKQVKPAEMYSSSASLRVSMLPGQFHE